MRNSFYEESIHSASNLYSPFGLRKTWFCHDGWSSHPSDISFGTWYLLVIFVCKLSLSSYMHKIQILNLYFQTSILRTKKCLNGFRQKNRIFRLSSNPRFCLLTCKFFLIIFSEAVFSLQAGGHWRRFKILAASFFSELSYLYCDWKNRNKKTPRWKQSRSNFLSTVVLAIPFC